MTHLAVLLVTLLLPPLLVLANTVLVVTPPMLSAAYTRPGFPQDPYGFTTEQRIELAPKITSWLGTAESVDELGKLRFADGKALLNARELRHMHDVKQLTGVTFRAATLAILVFTAAILRCRREKLLATALLRGALLTIGLLISIVVLAVASWDQIFTGFHRLFFEGGTWYFAYSDTLIRLFPEQFWFDVVLFLAGLTAAEALLLAWLTTRKRAVWHSQRRWLYWLPGKGES